MADYSALTTQNISGHSTVAMHGAVLFDLDGTLVDTAPDFRAVLHRLCAEHAVSVPSDADIHATVSSGARALINLAFGAEPDAMTATASPRRDYPGLLNALLDDYEAQLQHTQSRLYPGMEQLLAKLEQQQIPWGVVTNKPVRFSKPLIEMLGLSERCSVLICPDDVQHTKPHPEPLLLACTRTGRSARHSIYVGDHPRDIDAGVAAGMTTIAAAYGYLPLTPPVEDWQADMIVHSVKEIFDYLWPAARAARNI